MAYTPKNPNGQATMANSSPVVLASDQASIPVTATNLDVQSGGVDLATTTQAAAIQTSVELIDDTVKVLGTDTFTEGTSKGVVVGGVRRDADTAIVDTTNEFSPFLTDELGYLKVSTHPASITAYTDNITVNGDTVALDVSRYSNLTIYCTGTFATVNVTFEGSIDAGTSWFTVQGVRTNSNTVESTTGNLSAAPAYAWELSVNALTNFRVRATAYGSGTQVWRFQPGSYATEPIPAVQTHAITVASGGIASGAIASGAIASGAIASGAIASGAIAAGAIAAGATSIADNEDVARAAADRLVKVAQVRVDAPPSGANVSGTEDYTQFIADLYGKTWVAGSVTEDVAHAGGESVMGNGVRRIDTPASSAGSSGDWATMDATAEGAIWAALTPTTTGGLSVANFNSGDTYTALTNTAQVIKASAGNLYGYYIYNPNSSTAYVMIYNIAAASVTVGTSTAQMVLAIPAGAAANVTFPYPISFSNAGWSIAAATTGGGNSAPTTALEVMIYYK